MEAALYAPGSGYYDRERSPVGAMGDFYTAPQLHPIFGATLGRRISQVLDRIDSSRPVRLVELGPGNGELAAAVIGELARQRPGQRPLEYLLVERAPRRGKEALARAQKAAEGTLVRPRHATSLAEEGPFEGAVIAHEVLDAQPVRRFRRGAHGWQELGVRLEDGRLSEALRPLPPEEGVPDLPEGMEEGSVFEVAPRVDGLLREVADHLVEGAILLIDYGAEQTELLGAHRFGTLTAVKGHRVLDSWIDQAGRADLSAYVNFTRVRAKARSAGLVLVRDLSQAEALRDWGLEEVRARWGENLSETEALRLHLAVKNMLFGFAHFRALEFRARGSLAVT